MPPCQAQAKQHHDQGRKKDAVRPAQRPVGRQEGRKSGQRGQSRRLGKKGRFCGERKWHCHKRLLNPIQSLLYLCRSHAMDRPETRFVGGQVLRGIVISNQHDLQGKPLRGQ